MNLKKQLRAAAYGVAIMLMLYVAPNIAVAQQTTGDILGTVTDPTGAVVPGATVTAKDLGTQESRETTSTGAGDYVINLLKPGNYSVTITAGGFKRFAVTSVALAAGDRIRVDGKLAIGDTAQSVTVESVASALQTDSSVLSTSIGEQPTQDLPLNGRNYIQLVQLAPGVNEGPSGSLTNGTRPDDRRQTASVSANGQQEIMNNQMIDGADNYERLIGTVAVRPGIDAIGEINVQANTYTAEVGRSGGAIVNVITKSGTDQFHGDVFEFFRNDLFDASTYSWGVKGPKSELRQNQFGGAFGGPIIKNKTFFFGSYEGYRMVIGQPGNVLTVPTLFEEQNPGNFSDVGGPVLCTAPGTPAGCTGSIDPVGLDYFKMAPAPNKGTNQYVKSYNQIQNSTDYDARVDHSFNPNNTMYGRFIYNSVNTSVFGEMPAVTVAGINLDPNNGGNIGLAPDLDFDGLMNYIHSFDPHMLLELKAAYTHADNEAHPFGMGTNPNQAFGQANVNNTALGATGLAPFFVINGANYGNVLWEPLADKDNTFQYLGALTYTRGKHNIKVGGGVIRRQMTSIQSGWLEGIWIINGYQNELEGNFISNNGQYISLDNPHLRLWEPGVYVQDDWHATRKLTLNLGVRYDLFTPYTEIQNRISTWNPVTESLQIAGQNQVSNSAGVETDHHGLAPRVGFAYDFGHDFVVRGGFGIGYFPSNTTSQANLKNAPFSVATAACGSSGAAACAAGYTQLKNGFPVLSVNPTVLASLSTPGVSLPAAVSPSLRTSYVEQYNLTVQKDLHGNIATVSYVGVLGREMIQTFNDLNAPPPNNCNASPDPNCYQKLRPYYAKYPNLGSIAWLQTGGNSSYNALQASLERRLTAGLTVNANYAWAHSLSNAVDYSGGSSGGYGIVPSQVDKLDYGNDELDRRSRFAGSANYKLPFAKDATGLQAAALKGWQSNVILVWSTGENYTVTNSTNISDTVLGDDDRPNQVASVKVSHPTISKFFNTAAFVPQAAGTLGSERRNQLYGPHFRHVDFSIFKVFPIREQMNIEFRAESFNLSNTANFGQPDSTIGDNTFGQLTGMSGNYAPRELQFALKLTF